MQLAGQGVAHDLQNVALLGTRSRQKAQVTIGKTEDRNLAMVEDAGSAQQRTVPAERNDQIGAINIRRALNLRSLVGSPCDFIALARQPKLEHQAALDRLLLVVIGNHKDLHSVAAFSLKTDTWDCSSSCERSPGSNLVPYTKNSTLPLAP